MTKKSSRNANMELLRMISMLMVTFLHAIAKSDILVNMSSKLGINSVLAWVFEVLSIGAVNIFMLISGYFLINSEFKVKKLIEIVMQTVFYTAGTFLIFLVFGLVKPDDLDIYNLLNYFLPVHMEVYWFITAYVVLYILSPVITKGIKAISQKQLLGVIIGLLVYECVFKSVLPVRLVVDTKGYNFLWYIVVFLIGAYFRLYGFKFINSTLKGMLVYLGGATLVFAETFVIGKIYASTSRLGGLTKVALEYNHIFTLVTAVGIFAAFVHMKPMNEKVGRVICIFSPLALGVYLFQESLLLRYEWQEWFGLPNSLDDNPVLFVFRLVGAVLAVYVMGTAADVVRKLLFKGVYALAAKVLPKHEQETEKGESE